MEQIPVEKHGIRFYNYYFLGVEKPITIEARNKQQARDKMRDIISKLSEKYQESKIVGETIVIPLKGVSDKVVKGVRYVWVGEDKSKNGWLSENEYKRAVALSKMKARNRNY
jgi:hypothetical protein